MAFRAFVVVLVALPMMWLGACTSETETTAAESTQVEPQQPDEAPEAPAEVAAEEPIQRAPLSEALVRTALPSTVGGYKLKGMKTKHTRGRFRELSATYKGPKGKIKVVINEWIREAGNDWKPKNWKSEIEASGDRLSGFAVLSEKKGAKETVMVQLSDSIRVDSKSRDVFGKKLRDFAKKIDYKALAKLASGRSE